MPLPSSKICLGKHERTHAMTSDPRDQTTEKTLEHDLGKIRSVLSGADSPEPPDLLDQAVLNTARRELESAEKKWPRRFSPRWLGAFATASVVILALGVIVQQEQESTPFTNAEHGRVKLENDAAVTAKKAAADSQEMMKNADRDESKMSRASPMAAAPARADEILEQELADDLAGLEEADAEILTAEDWISLMLQLQSSNQQAQLIEELAAFKSAYPVYPLPPELSN